MVQVPAKEFGTSGWPITLHPAVGIFSWPAADERTAVIRRTEQVYGRRKRARASHDERRRLAGLTSIVRSQRSDVQSRRVRPRPLYQAHVTRGPAVPSPDPFFLVARGRTRAWKPRRRSPSNFTRRGHRMGGSSPPRGSGRSRRETERLLRSRGAPPISSPDIGLRGRARDRERQPEGRHPGDRE